MVHLHCTERKQHARLYRLLSGIVLVAALSNVHAERVPGLIHQQSLGACLNPLGMLLESRMIYRVPLSQDTGILFRTACFESGIINEWSPGDELIGASVNIEPIAIFNIRAKGGLYENYRAFGFGYRRIAGRDGAYNDSVLAEIKQENHPGSRLTLAPSLKLKVGPIVFADNLALNRIDFFTTEGYYYELRTALPHAVHDFDVVNDVLLFYEINKKWLAGLNYNVVYVKGTDIRQQKLGCMVVVAGPWKNLTSLYGLVTGGVYLESELRNHTPYIAALCGFEMPFTAGKRRIDSGAGDKPAQ
jgi:hypothetical protein